MPVYKLQSWVFGADEHTLLGWAVNALRDDDDLAAAFGQRLYSTAPHVLSSNKACVCGFVNAVP